MANAPEDRRRDARLYLFTFHKAAHADDLRRTANDKGRFSDALVMPSVVADYDIALISFNGESFDRSCLFSAGRHTSTGRRRGKFEHISPLPSAIPMKALLRRAGLTTPRVDATQAIAPSSIGTASKVFEWISTGPPAAGPHLGELLALRSRMLESRSEPAYLTRSEQRDAVGLVLDIANMNRAEILGSASQRHTSGSSGSYLDSLPPTTSERRLIEEDMSVFGDWGRSHNKYRTTRTFTDKETTVTLMCVDGDKIEATEGVDLIYHFDRYNSLVMVQYKRMSDGKYHPDRRCREQTDRMSRAYESIRSDNVPPHTERDYRLSRNPFFLKVCDGAIPIENNEALIEGMYFPLDHWGQVIDEPTCIGPKGGRTISRGSSPRWLNNTEFVSLAKRGWIGTTARMGREWAADLVQKHIQDLHSLILARIVNTPPKESERDSAALRRGWKRIRR